MRALILIILAILAIAATADETEEDVKVIKGDIGIDISKCHPGHETLVHVIPIPINDRRAEGWFKTTNSVLSLRDLSMLPDGLNRIEFQNVCRGSTGELSSAVFDLQRPPPPPKVVVKLIRPKRTNSSVPLRFSAPSQPMMPPMPPGMAQHMPLPDAETNKMSYKDSWLMRQYYSLERRGK